MSGIYSCLCGNLVGLDSFNQPLAQFTREYLFHVFLFSFGFRQYSQLFKAKLMLMTVLGGV